MVPMATETVPKNEWHIPHWYMWNLALEFRKCLPLPWKQYKTGQNGPKTPKSGIYFLKMVGQMDRNFDGMVPPMYQCGICH